MGLFVIRHKWLVKPAPTGNVHSDCSLGRGGLMGLFVSRHKWLVKPAPTGNVCSDCSWGGGGLMGLFVFGINGS